MLEKERLMIGDKSIAIGSARLTVELEEKFYTAKVRHLKVEYPRQGAVAPAEWVGAFSFTRLALRIAASSGEKMRLCNETSLVARGFVDDVKHEL